MPQLLNIASRPTRQQLPVATSSASAETNEPALPIVLVYEDMTAALRAVGQLFKLRCQLPGGFEQRLSTWNFAMLDQPDLRARVSADTAAAGLIVIAASSPGRQLPAHVANWLRDALSTRADGQPCAVAPLFTHQRQPDGPDSPRLRYVHHLAAETGALLLSPDAASLPQAAA